MYHLKELKKEPVKTYRESGAKLYYMKIITKSVAPPTHRSCISIRNKSFNLHIVILYLLTVVCYILILYV